jgi:hypothetical protein
MKNEDLKNLIRKSYLENLNVPGNDQMDERILGDACDAMKQSLETPSALTRPNVWRTIMKSKITKFAAAAVVIMAFVLTITLMDKSISSAYALEQTVKAYESLRFVHIKGFKEGQSEPQELWVAFDEQEQVKSFRLHNPAWHGSPSNGTKVFVWNSGKLRTLEENGKVAVIIPDQELAREIRKIVKENDPRYVVNELYRLEAEGKVKIEISTPQSQSEHIQITATYLPGSSDPGKHMILAVDRKTRLVTYAVVQSQKSVDGYLCSGRMEFSDYNQKADNSLFALDVPENAIELDVTGSGMEQNGRSDNEIAVELARQFIQAMIDKDYEKAGKLCGGVSTDKIQKQFIQYKKVLRLEQPIANPSVKGEIDVPCVVVVKRGGSGVYAMRKNLRMGPAFGDKTNKTWIVFEGGVIEESLQQMVDPTDTTSTFLANLNTRLASLDINQSTAEDVIAVLGEPWAYGFQGKDLLPNDLPETYGMEYPGHFTVSIHKNQVTEWGQWTMPKYDTFHSDYTLFDSIRFGSTQDEFFKVLPPPAKTIEGYGADKASKKIMYEDNVIYAGMNINERKGFCFSRTEDNGEKVSMYFDDNVLYQDVYGQKGLCFYGTVYQGKRIRVFILENQITVMYEYRTEPVKNIE